ncbi:MAG TPA: UbiD family decarboxylase [Stellaceae bacterium]|nr:UbiD family decarboxylase [Stellaceae bacterium]
MPSLGLRTLIDVLEQKQRVRRIAKTVDRTWEPACIAKWMFQALPDEERFGIIFESVKGSKFRLATGILGSSRAAYAMALGVEPDEINEKWVDALLHPREPVEVARAPSQEVVEAGDAAKLSDLPIPVWTPGKDAAPYITTLVLTKSAETGIQNMGVYRTQVRDDHSVVINLNPAGQGTRNARTYMDKGKPAPIAWVIGADPAVLLAATAKLPYGVNEATIAGGLTGAPIELVKAKTVDLMVPANAEFIIEGEVIPGEIAQEGPFGEFAGYMGGVGPRPVARITAITHRKDAIYYGFSSQMPPSESTIMQSLSNAGVLLKQLRYDLGEPTVTDAVIDLNYGGTMGHVIVAMEPRDAAHSKRIGCLVANMTGLKRITMVDPDIDIRDPDHIDWALNARMDPGKDIVVVEGAQFAHMDPSVRPVGGRPGPASKLVVDATLKVDAGTFSLPSKDYMMRALELWKEAGLPEFEMPKRARLRIDRS